MVVRQRCHFALISAAERRRRAIGMGRFSAVDARTARFTMAGWKCCE